MENTETGGVPVFRAAPFGLLRLPTLPSDRAAASVLDLDPEDPAESGRMAAYVRELVADPVFREALEVSSPALAHTLDAIESGAPIPFARLRRTVYAVTNYLLRMSSRPTPFGLMAGVSLAEIGVTAPFRSGTAGHHKAVRPDMSWLLAAVTRWEREPVIVRQLHIVANDFVTLRGERMTLPYVREQVANAGARTYEVSVQHTAAVRCAMELTRHPVPYPALVRTLLATFPAPEPAVVGMLDQLIEQEFLLTDLRPPQDAADPLRHVLDRLAAVDGHPEVATLRELPAAIDTYACCPLGAGRPALRALVSRMGAERPVQVDLRIDAHVGLPAAVGRELADSAGVLWRLAPEGPSDHLREYRDAFVDRYGHDQAVGIKELLDSERGLGPPAGYLWPAGARRSEPRHEEDPDRQRMLGAIAQRAHRDGLREIVVDAPLLAGLSRPHADPDPPPALDLCATLMAGSLDAVAAGDYRLVLADGLGAMEPGGFFGRFLHLFDGAAGRVGALSAPSRLGGTEGIAVQMLFQPTNARLLNVCQVQRILDHRAVIGAYADRSDPQVLGLDDLAVAAGSHRLYVWSRSLRREVVPMSFHMLNPHSGQPNAVRLLGEIAQLRHRTLHGWRWGAASWLPYLPRVRHGHTILSSARWLPPPALRDTAQSWPSWLLALRIWREQWAVPDQVEITTGDQRISVDLTVPLHQRLLWRELRKSAAAVLTEQPAGGEFGTAWCAGHANEIVVPLTPHPDAPRPVPPRRGPVTASTRQHHPGGEWLYAKVYVAEEHQDELLTERLPELLDRIGDLTDRWFFLRYTDPDPHLRIRIHGEPQVVSGKILAALHEWADANGAAGTMRRMVLDTYEPESARYGGAELEELVERVFAADSAATITQLRLLAEGAVTLAPELVAAASHVDMARRLCGPGWAGSLLSWYPKNPRHHAAFRTGRALACRLIDSSGTWPELASEPGGERLIAAWEQRSSALVDYGVALRSGAVAVDRVDSAAASLLHMHCNRLLGSDHEAEGRSYAIARGAVQADRDRLRFTR